MTSERYYPIDIPFEYRHVCWFCGEPANRQLSFPFDAFSMLDCRHLPLTIPTCQECLQLAKADKTVNVYQCRKKVKQRLVSRYKKHLAIGKNWTKEELENSELEGKAFEGFKKSGWMMFEIAQQRVNYGGWPLTVDYQQLDIEDESEGFWFDGTQYPSVSSAVAHYCDVFYLDKGFLENLVAHLGLKQFARAVSLARANIELTNKEKDQLLKQMAKSRQTKPV